MLQQTRMEVVLRYFREFLRRFPTVEALAAASYDEVTAAWSGLGYYRRARMLRDGAVVVRDRFRGVLPAEPESLRSIPGIGRYTAGAIASVAYDRPAPIVDGNIARLLARLCHASTSAAAWKHAAEIVRTAHSPRICNQALMEIGALICRPSEPDCPRCPLRRECAAFAAGRTGKLPPKKTSAPRAMRIPLYVISDRRGRILMRRHTGPLMDGMFHLPHGNGRLFDGWRLEVGSSRRLGSFRHTITNRRIEFTVLATSHRPPGAGRHYRWIDPGELASIPHPSYVRKALQVAGINK